MIMDQESKELLQEIHSGQDKIILILLYIAMVVTFTAVMFIGLRFGFWSI